MTPHVRASGLRGASGPLIRTLFTCALLLAFGAAALVLIFSTEPEAESEQAVRETAMLVVVTRPEAGTFRPVIEAMGTVVPAREITLRARVSGRVVALSDAFEPGGYVDQGEILVWLDDADFRNALAQRESELIQAVAQLDIERGQQDLAERDYRDLGRDLSEDKEALVLREPQRRSAEAEVQSARAALDQARLELKRTSVAAPFDAHVLSREVNLGSEVSAGDPLARLVGLDTYWVETTIPVDKLRWLAFSDGGRGAPVRVRNRTAWPADDYREGYLYRLVGELEGNTRMARALVAVDDPLAREASDAPPLMIGEYVACRIQGREIADVVRLSRDYVRKDDTVWVMDDGRLAIRPLDIVFRDAEFAYVRDGLSADDRVVTTNLATVEEGIRLRVEDAPESGAATP